MTSPTPFDREGRLAVARNVWLATVRPDRRPHLVPVWFVSTGEKLYVCIEPASVKGRNLGANSSVSLALEDGTHPVIAEGVAQPLGRPWPAEVARLFRVKYDWDIESETTYTMLVEVVPRKWLGW